MLVAPTNELDEQRGRLSVERLGAEDETRHAFDRAVLVDLLGLPESVLEPLALLRTQWCCEPTVHGGKATRPDVQVGDGLVVGPAQAAGPLLGTV